MSKESSPLFQEDREKNQSKRYGISIASVFVVGTICGAGVLTVPQAVVNSGWTGVALLIICGLVAAYNGILLGDCWSLLRKRYPRYDHTRVTDPYQIIGFRAAGKLGEIATRLSVHISLFGAGTGFTLLIAENVKNLIQSFGGGEFHLCYLVMILWCFLTPMSWLGTPKDFWQSGVIAAATSSFAGLLIAAGILTDASLHQNALPNNITVSRFFNAFGTILYAYGGANCFPTFQVDMANPNKFPAAVVIGISAVLIVYLSIGISGLVVIGAAMTPNVINVLPFGPITYAINILMTLHFLMVLTVITNPVNQEIEGFFRVPDHFSWRRALIRSLCTSAMIFVALSVPHFDVILSLLGGSTVACTSFIFPPLFYFLLARQKTRDDAHKLRSKDLIDSFDDIAENKNEDWTQDRLHFLTKVLIFVVVFVGIVGALCTTYFAFATIVKGGFGFTVPCYVDVTVE